MVAEHDLQFENEVRIYIYEHFVSQCRAPTIVEVADALAMTTDRIQAAFESLADRHVLVLHPDSHRVWMAMPFFLRLPVNRSLAVFKVSGSTVMRVLNRSNPMASIWSMVSF